jgi:hypothetical protein
MDPELFQKPILQQICVVRIFCIQSGKLTLCMTLINHCLFSLVIVQTIIPFIDGNAFPSASVRPVISHLTSTAATSGLINFTVGANNLFFAVW